jgi:hypothetical protein
MQNNNTKSATFMETTLDLILERKKMNLALKIQRIYRFYRKTKKLIVKESEKLLLPQHTTETQGSKPNLLIGKDQESKSYDKLCFNENRIFAEYLGEKINGEKSGFGIQTWKDGAKYIGNFSEDKACGFGGFRHSDGDYYKGRNNCYGFR